jgi:glycosyltransferase involved in cell wall biosynthesis
MSKTRRFAFVSPNYFPRTCGVGDHSMRIGQELMRRGHEVTVFSRAPVQPNPEGAEVPAEAIEGPTPMVIAERLRRRLQELRPTELVIQYTSQMLGASRFGSLAMPWLAAAARFEGVNVVVLAHELFLPVKSRPDLAVGAATTRAQLALLMKLANRTIVTMGTRVAELAPITGALKLPPPGVVPIAPNALPVPATHVPGRLRLGIFSTLASTKKFDVVLDCFEAVHRRWPHAELVVLGDLGDPASARVAALHAAIAKHPGASRIRVSGRLDLPAVAREVAELDIYLFPMISGANTRSGTLPLALGSGVPVVTIHGYETDDVFVNEENILFARALTGEAFAEAVFRLLDDAPLRGRLSQGGVRLYEDYMSWPKTTDLFLSLI